MSSWQNNRYKNAVKDAQLNQCYLYDTNYSDNPYAVGMQMMGRANGNYSAGQCGSFTAVSFCSGGCLCTCLCNCNIQNTMCIGVLCGSQLVGTWVALTQINAGWIGPIMRVG